MKKESQEVILILDNIRSIHNVGSIFRIADTLGLSKLYLVGTTADPIDRFGRTRNDLAKVALGAEKNLKWEHYDRMDKLLTKLKAQGFKIVAIEQSKQSIDYKKIKLSQNKVAFLVGEEVHGLPKSVLGQVDIIAEIPMRGKKESLNVAVATGVALFRILNQ